MCPLSEKVKVLEVIKISGKNKSSICEIVKKEKEIHSSFQSPSDV